METLLKELYTNYKIKNKQSIASEVNPIYGLTSEAIYFCKLTLDFLYSILGTIK